MGRTLSGNQVGALWMLGSAISFTLEASLLKALGADYSPAVILFWRQAVAVLLLTPLIGGSWRTTFATTKPGLIFGRSVTGVLGVWLSIAAYSQLPLADANALSFTRILWMAILGPLFLKEALGLPRAAATVVGFVGVLIMLRPGAQGVALTTGHLAAIAAALLAALTILNVKALAKDHTVLTLTVYSAMIGLVLSAPLAMAQWSWPPAGDLPLLVALGVFGLITLTCYTKGMQWGEAVIMAPIDYTRLILAAGVGLVVFGEAIVPATVIGALVIVGSTFYLLTRQRAVSAKM